MPLRRFRRQYEQLLQFERGRIIGMMEAGWSARRVARRPRQTSRRKDHNIVRNARSWPTASLAVIQTQVEHSKGAPMSSPAIRRRLAKMTFGLRVLPLIPTHRRPRLEWCHALGNWTTAQWNQIVFSDESRFNLSSNYNRVYVWRLRCERLNPVFALQRHTAPTADVMVWECHCLQYTVTSSIDPWHHDSPVVYL
ncbi:transposable element Tcb2 transposase [Trichonephila clavipes]|nr:transposable element Tcb2 transposase [Trichonephila clavipes]